MSDDTRLNGIQRVEGVSGGTAVAVSISSSNQLDTIHNDLVLLGNYVDSLEGFSDGVEGLLQNLGNFTDTLEGLTQTLGNNTDGLEGFLDGVEGKLDTLHGDLQTLGNNTDSLEGYLDGVEGKLDTLHGDLQTLGNYTDTLEAKLPSTIGQHNSTDALCIVPATDAAFGVAAPENAIQTIRSYSGSSADTEPPTDVSAWVTLTGATIAGYLDVHFAFTAVGGTVPPTQVRIKLWNRIGGNGGTIKKIHDKVYPAAELIRAVSENAYTRIHRPMNCDEVFATVTFPDGTSPTITGDIKGRLVAHAALQRSDLDYDPATGNLIVQPTSYDAVSDTLKNSPATFECDLALPEALIVDTTGLTAGTEYYYPSADGALMDSYDSITFEYSATAANNGTVQVWFETTLGSNSWTQRNICTLSGWSITGGAFLASTPVTSAVNGTIADQVQFDVNTTRIRMVVKPVTGNSGAVKASMRRKVR